MTGPEQIDPDPIDPDPIDPASIDGQLMTRALVLGASALRRTAPNPWVGCVVVRDGVVVGEGASEPAGGAHAEVLALREAGDRASRSTLYVTLEPCSHHGRTPPCVDAVVAADVRRVVVALADPDRRVAGTGLAALRAHGLEVEVGLGAAEAARSLAPYLHHRRTGRAFCLLKTAMSLDGRTAAADGSSQWITGEPARADAHELRAESQAVVVGSGTALADDPALSVRGVLDPPLHPPLRVLLDGRGRVPASGPLFDPTLGPTLVVTSDAAPSGAVDAWRSAGAGVEVLPTAHEDTAVDLRALLELLGREGVLQAMFEGGATVHGSLLAAHLVDRVVAYVAPMVLGEDARAAFGTAGAPTLSGVERLRFDGARTLGDDVRLDYARRDEARAVAATGAA